MKLEYLTEEAYKLLRKDWKENAPKYDSDDPWMDAYFSDAGLDEYVKESSIEVPEVELVCSGTDSEAKNRDDRQNIRVLYGAYKDVLTPLQASDPVLWTTLCHRTFRSYILQRWRKEDGEVSIGQRFFATRGRASLCYYNAVSRLWWSGHLTYDEEEKGNPYHLTEVLFSAQQIQKDLFDQSLSMNREVVKGLLSALHRIQEKTGSASTTVFRACCDSYLNHYGAVTSLDVLSAEDIEQIAYAFMSEQVSSGKNGEAELGSPK